MTARPPRTAPSLTSAPDGAPTRAAEPRTAQPRGAQPRTAQPRTAQPQTGQPRTAQPRTAQPRTAPARGAQSRTSQSRTAPARAPQPAAQEFAPTDTATESLATTFAELGVPTTLVNVLTAQGITKPFPIQAATLPDALAGRDVLGRGRTGSGKTYAFVLPVLTRLAGAAKPRQSRRPRALILAPTRELATQIDAAIAPLAKQLSLKAITIFGGVGAGRQIAELRAGVDIVVACPGRLEDHASTGNVDLSAVEITVIDEADHMADLGFLPVVKRVLDQTPRDGQRLLFSATLDSGVDVLIRRYLRNPVTHSVDSAPVQPTVQAHHVLHGRADDHLAVLVELTSAPGRTIVFTRTKHRAKALTRRLVAAGVPAVELHGNLNQGARDRNLSAFSAGTATTLVATDIAARGIHVDNVRLVIHADPPSEHKAYVHRSGRTARAGETGTVISLIADEQLTDVHRLARQAGIHVTTTRVSSGHPLLAELAPGERVLVAPPAAALDHDQPSRTAPRQGANRARSGAGQGRTGTGQGRAGTGQGRSGAGQGRTGTSQSRGGTGQGRAATGRAGGGQTRSTVAYSSTTPSPGSVTAEPGGAAAFSARSRTGTRRGR